MEVATLRGALQTIPTVTRAGELIEQINILFLISEPTLHFQDFEEILQSLQGHRFACVLTGAKS